MFGCRGQRWCGDVDALGQEEFAAIVFNAYEPHYGAGICPSLRWLEIRIL